MGCVGGAPFNNRFTLRGTNYIHDQTYTNSPGDVIMINGAMGRGLSIPLSMLM